MVEPVSKKRRLENGELGSAEESASDSPISTDVKSPVTELKMANEIKDLYTEKYQLEFNLPVNSVKISPDGETLAYCTSSGVIRVHGLQDGHLICELKGHTKGISDIDYSPINADVIASASDDLTVRLWSISKQKCIKILKKHTYHVTTVKFSLKGNILITGSADETITIWDLSSGRNLKTLAAHSDPILSICLSPDNTIIASGSYDGLMRLFDCETGQCLKTLVYNTSSHGTATASTNDVVNPPISCVEFSPNGKYILSSSLDGVIRLWDYMNNKVLKTFANDKPICEKFTCSAKFIPCTLDPLVVSGSDEGDLIFWNVQSKAIICNNIHVDGPILDIDWSQEGKVLAFCSKNGTVTVLDVNEKYVR